MKEDKFLELIIETTQGIWEHSFEKTEKVHDVIQSIINYFHFATDGHYEIRLASNPNEILEPERPLVSYHIADKDVLVFTDLGIAV